MSPFFESAAARSMGSFTRPSHSSSLTTIQRKRNREGKPWASMQLEDLSGSVEALLFTTQYERLQSMLEEDKAVLVREFSTWLRAKRAALPDYPGWECWHRRARHVQP